MAGPFLCRHPITRVYKLNTMLRRSVTIAHPCASFTGTSTCEGARRVYLQEA